MIPATSDQRRPNGQKTGDGHRRMGTAFALLCCLSLAIIPGLSAHAQAIDACDWEVAHPSDPDRVGPGRSSGDVDTTRAIAACQDRIRKRFGPVFIGGQ